MSSRSNKERQLKKNIELSKARAIQAAKETNQRELTAKEEQYFEDELMKAVPEAESKLPRIWNDKSVGKDDFKRPDLGFFGGVNFDKNGKIIRG